MEKIKIGTRSSQMALAQTEEIAARLASLSTPVGTEIVRFKPRGDVDQTSKLDSHGGKGGAFVSEIRDAIRRGELNGAMHSLKDVPGDEETMGLVFSAYLKREAVEDVLVLRSDHHIDAFLSNNGAGYKIGTNSVRRAACLKRLYPECEVIHFRGAADTRLSKLEDRIPQQLPNGEQTAPADALIMARSGLVRIQREDAISKVFSTQEMIPAVGQGVVVVECAERDWNTRALLSDIDDRETRICALAEREMLWILNGHCNSPIAGYAELFNDRIKLRACVMGLDGQQHIFAEDEGAIDCPRDLGRRVAFSLLRKGAGDIIAATQP